YWGKGYAHESAAAVMEYGKRAFGLTRLVAITTPDNYVSARLLEKLGFNFERMVRLHDVGAEIKLFAANL
ncbi:MAG: GNAT family N-acetyltransferase, partial [Acidobacteriota bacterium]|nr:GNAT family N-acetyltransferase [Acidobacteriota bacterium]